MVFLRNDNLLFSIKEFPKCGYFVHANSQASPQYYGTIPFEVIGLNVVGTCYLLDYATESGCAI